MPCMHATERMAPPLGAGECLYIIAPGSMYPNQQHILLCRNKEGEGKVGFSGGGN